VWESYISTKYHFAFSFLAVGKVDLESETDQWDDFRFVKWLAKKKQLLGIPPSAFYSLEHKHQASSYIRFNFYKRHETLKKAKDILQRVGTSSS